MVNAVLLRPLPLPDSERLVLLKHAAPQLAPLDDLPMSDALHFLYAEHSRTLDGVAGFSDVAVGFTDPDDPQRMPAASVTASFFDVLRTPPRLGRPFTAEEDRPRAVPVVVLGDGLWRSRFGADPRVVGRLHRLPRLVPHLIPRDSRDHRPESSRGALVRLPNSVYWNALTRWGIEEDRVFSGQRSVPAAHTSSCSDGSSREGTTKGALPGRGLPPRELLRSVARAACGSVWTKASGRSKTSPRRASSGVSLK